jgi:hypothetical protein
LYKLDKGIKMKKIRISLMVLFAIAALAMTFTSFSEPGEPGPFYRCIHTNESGSEQFWITQADWFCEVKHSEIEHQNTCDDEPTNDGNQGGGGFCGGSGNQSGEDCVITAEPVD